MAVTAVTQGESYAPADRNESCTLRLEKAEITGTVTSPSSGKHTSARRSSPLPRPAPES